MNDGEAIRFFVNGQVYPMTSPNITTPLCGNVSITASSGDLVVNGTPSSNGYGLVQITSLIPIDSIEIYETTANKTGTNHDFYFALDTAAILKKNIEDTVVCRGDTIHADYDVLTRFNTNNQFILQLSNATGSFANPLNIGVVNSDTTGTVNGIVPTTVANGTGYRVRIIATSPKDTTIDNGKDIKIGTLPYTVTAGSNSPVCAGGALKLNASLVPKASYLWSGPAFSSGQQNPQKTPVLSGDAGNYTVTAQVSGCSPLTANTTVVVNTGPSVSIYANPNDTICDGQGVSFSSIPVNGGTNPAYQWYKNGAGISSAVNKTYSATGLVNKDTFYVTMTATGSTCNTPIASNAIIMTLIPNTTNLKAGITVDPSGPVWAGLQLKFTAAVTGCNGDVSYQWMQDGKPIQGATTNPWLSTRLSNKVNISCVVKCHGCALPDTAISDTLKMDVSTGVEERRAEDGERIVVYPNPNDGVFLISSPTAFKAAPPQEGTYRPIATKMGKGFISNGI